MIHSNSVSTRLCCTWLAIVGYTGAGFADDSTSATDHAAVVAPFVNDDTFLVAYFDPAALGVSDDGQKLRELVPQLPPPSPGDLVLLRAWDSAMKSLQSAGVQGVYTVVGLRDLHVGGGPVVAVVVAPGRDVQAAENMLLGVAQAFQTALAGPLRSPELRVRRHPSGAILIGQQPTLDRYLTAVAHERPDFIEPLTTMADGGAALAAVVSPGADFRRVVRELWPPLPPPLEAWRGELADRWLRLELIAKTQAANEPPSGPSIELTMQASDAASAERFVRLLRALPAASAQFSEPGGQRHDLQPGLSAVIDYLSPQVDGTRVVVKLPTDETQLVKLRSVISDATGVALESARRQQRMSQFKQLALAMHTYMDKYKHLPPAAIRDQDGRTLLSWRVAILPYVEQNNLYKQFHLDEPWDSPHNLALTKNMPEIYGDPAHSELAREGKTTYVVPVGAGTVFDTPEGLVFRDIKDGAAKTIMIVEVPPERAVVWTKPEDWEVDMEHPLRDIERSDRDYITSAWCDGHVSAVPANTSPDALRAALTRSGGETVDSP